MIGINNLDGHAVFVSLFQIVALTPVVDVSGGVTRVTLSDTTSFLSRDSARDISAQINQMLSNIIHGVA